MIHRSTCYLNHTKTHRGPFAGFRQRRWWAKHQHPQANECDTCANVFEYEPEGSFQTYLGEWFCSDECGRCAGW